jgi:hypothetical protein
MGDFLIAEIISPHAAKSSSSLKFDWSSCVGDEIDADEVVSMVVEDVVVNVVVCILSSGEGDGDTTLR